MSIQWTPEQVLQLSPDSASAKNGKKLATTAKWVTLGYNSNLVWGECQGSGSKPYQTRIALDEPAFKCSCPSRKFPCKHALALFLLYAEQLDAFTEQTDPPAWVADWLAKRQQRKTKANTKSDKPVDAKAQAKRTEKRAIKVEAGIDELRLWLHDNMRNGLAALKSQPYAFFNNTAARLVDAQASGLAAQVRHLADIVHRGDDDWASQSLRAMAQLHLLLESYPRLATLPTALQCDIRSLVGWTHSKEEVLQQPAVKDEWFVLGQYVEQEADFITQRIWLYGIQQQTSALVINFAHVKQQHSLDIGWVTGKTYHAELIYYPSSVPLRALVKQRTNMTKTHPSPTGFNNWLSALQHYRHAVRQHPWLARFPLLMQAVYPHKRENNWYLQDNEQRCIPLMIDEAIWTLLAVSGGQSVTLFGEWRTDGYFYPLSVLGEQGYLSLIRQSGTA